MLKLCQNNEEQMIPHESTANQVSRERGTNVTLTAVN